MSFISRLFSFICVIFLSLTSLIIFPQSTLAVGITENHLTACPTSPNCVVSQNGDEKHAIEPIPYHVDRDKAKETLLKVLTVVPRTEVVEETDNYIHALSKSRIFKFTDDVEFYFPTDENVIHVRSASRVGESDLGVNKRRIEQIRLAMEDLKV
ncbi:MAG: DUF1499 domain-containing protein [Cyanobacteria bacterium P01_C01_bin.38]